MMAVETLRERITADPAALPARGLRPRDVDKFKENLEATYLIRLFAEFEAALRDVWANCYRRRSEPPARTLINSVAARCGVPDPDLEETHRVRNHRNTIVHEAQEEEEPVPLLEAKTILGRFLARLPPDW